MCGIVGFVGNDTFQAPAAVDELNAIAKALRDASARESDWQGIADALARLHASFAVLGSFALHRELAVNPATKRQFADLAVLLGNLRGRVADEIARHGRTDELEQLKERLADYAWQLERELCATVERVAQLLPVPLGDASRNEHYVAWALEQVLQALDKLEVRGRDSAGLSLLLELDAVGSADAALADVVSQELTAPGDETGARQVARGKTSAGHATLRFTHRVANLVGRLGDNGAALRAGLRADFVLWRAARHANAVNIMCHTRWASNGIINVPNCHPVDGRVLRGSAVDLAGYGAAMVLNGDVDNYTTLVATSVEARGVTLHPAVSTDAKILPVLFALDTDTTAPLFARFGAVLKRSHGSLATVLQHIEHPRTLFVGQKGSGQALYLGDLHDGWLVASEVYGLATLSRFSRPLNAGGEIGIAVELGTRGAQNVLAGVSLGDGGPWEPKVDPIQIFSRDIFRGDSPTYIEKEIGEAPLSVEKTLAGKYLREGDKIRFVLASFGNGEGLRARLRSRERPPIRRVIVIGMGTAGIAGMGAAHFIRQSVASTGIVVSTTKACELFGFTEDERLDDAIVVAVSQSGTTTDTNRVVDMARERGAWIHAIVNRRNSALVHKADSVLYTSDGRDVEMSVASTKAFYSQIAAGKLLGLLLGSELGTMNDLTLRQEIDALEQLPEKIRTVLGRKDHIFAVASKWPPSARNWAIVGNGPNRVAAEEIRIKLSELCYKGIPCDVTEDKKHIDLSTEPLTIVIANDLSEMVVQDTAKEVAIFKAHNGRPLVVCADGETRFDGVAQATLPVPSIGGGLGFVLATVVGHLFGVAAARAIDEGARSFRDARAVLSRVAEQPDSFSQRELSDALRRCLETVEVGHVDSSLPPRYVARLARYQSWLDRQPGSLSSGDALLGEASAVVTGIVEELTRPLDTIRHQAKTVTVGISRPGRVVSPLVLEAFTAAGVSPDALHQLDRELLEVVSPLIANVGGGVLYEVATDPTAQERPAWTLRAIRGVGGTRVEDSKYRTPQPALGSKRRVLRTGATCSATGPRGEESMLLVPFRNATGNVIAEILLLHVELVPSASLSQKRAALAGLHNKLEELVEEAAERLRTTDVDAVIRAASPRTLVFEPVHRIITLAAE